MHPVLIVVILAFATALVQKIMAYVTQSSSRNNQVVRADGGESICVFIVVHPGTRCEGPIREVLSTASQSHRLRLHVLKGLGPTETKADLPPEHRIVVDIVYSRHRAGFDGATELMHKIPRCYAGEDFLSVLPSDATLAVGWDERLVRCIRRCSSKHPVLSTLPPRTGVFATTFPRVRRRLASGGVVLEDAAFSEPMRRPQPTLFVLFRFLFAPGYVARMMPKTTAVRSDVIDAVLSLVLWTNGCDFFAPPETVLWSNEMHHRPVAPASKVGVAEVGTERSAEEFAVFSGVGGKGVSRRARIGLTPRATVNECMAKYGVEAPLMEFDEMIRQQRDQRPPRHP